MEKQEKNGKYVVMMWRSRRANSHYDLASNLKTSKTIVGFLAKLKHLKNSKKKFDRNKLKFEKNYDAEEKMSLKASRPNSSRGKKLEQKNLKEVSNLESSGDPDISCYDYNAALSQPDIPDLSAQEKKIEIEKTSVVEGGSFLNRNEEDSYVIGKKFVRKSRIPRAKKPGFVTTSRISRIYPKTKCSTKLSVKNVKKPAKLSVATSAKISTTQVDVNLQANRSFVNEDIQSSPLTVENATSLSMLPRSKFSPCRQLSTSHVSKKSHYSPKASQTLNWPKYNISKDSKSRCAKAQSSSDDPDSISIDLNDVLERERRKKPKKFVVAKPTMSRVKQKEQNPLNSFLHILFDIVFWPFLFSRNNRSN